LAGQLIQIFTQESTCKDVVVHWFKIAVKCMNLFINENVRLRETTNFLTNYI